MTGYFSLALNVICGRVKRCSPSAKSFGTISFDFIGTLPSSRRQRDEGAATYSEDEADGGHAGGGHDFGTVGDQVEQDGHGGLGRVVEAAAQHRRQVAEWWGRRG